MKHITITIDPTGKVLLEGKGFIGRECDKKMEEFEKQLGAVTDRKNSPEYSKTVTITQKVGS